ncbi:hypothetical protein [Bacteroides sp.]
MRRIYLLLLVLLLSIAILLIITDNDYGAIVALVFTFPLYFNQAKYVLSDTSLTVKQGGFQWNAHTIPWSSVTKFSLVKNGFRIDYTTPDVKKGFYIIRETYIENGKVMREMIEKRIGV